jgi:23S rRNA (cytidine1920-2'-O)/16S rRNA (cytidine1409-2'-O)-methyltransferase
LRKLSLLHFLSYSYPNIPRKTLYARILCGEVSVNGEKLRDPKCLILPDASLEFSPKRYVSRGGIKLEYALLCTDFDVQAKVVLDAGSSTGGFTDCLLQYGAGHVHAVDVGKNQLAYRLRIDPRVSVHEGTNIMNAPRFDPEPQVAVADISFRSLRRAALRVIEATSEKRALVLVKPQFEWPKEDRSFRGVVKGTSNIRRALVDIAGDLDAERVFVCDVVASLIA